MRASNLADTQFGGKIFNFISNIGGTQSNNSFVSYRRNFKKIGAGVVALIGRLIIIEGDFENEGIVILSDSQTTSFSSETGRAGWPTGNMAGRPGDWQDSPGEPGNRGQGGFGGGHGGTGPAGNFSDGKGGGGSFNGKGGVNPFPSAGGGGECPFAGNGGAGGASNNVVNCGGSGGGGSGLGGGRGTGGGAPAISDAGQISGEPVEEPARGLTFLVVKGNFNNSGTIQATPGDETAPPSNQIDDGGSGGNGGNGGGGIVLIVLGSYSNTGEINVEGGGGGAGGGEESPFQGGGGGGGGGGRIEVYAKTTTFGVLSVSGGNGGVSQGTFGLNGGTGSIIVGNISSISVLSQVFGFNDKASIALATCVGIGWL